MEIQKSEVLTQLDKILVSNDFAASDRLKTFFRYIVEKTLEGKESTLKAYTIALEVFELGKNFDSRFNPLVRTEAGRLRSKLDYYYRLHPDDEILIEIPKGGYVARFAKLESQNIEGTPVSKPDASISTSPLGHKGTILILPFLNISKNDDQQELVNGLLKQLVHDLSKFYELNVVDYCFSELATKGVSEQEVKEAALKYNARFVLNGSLQEQSGTFRIWVSLRDSTTHYVLWAEQYEGKSSNENPFQVQDQIVESIIYKIAGEFGAINTSLQREYARNNKASNALEEAMLLYTRYAAYLTLESFELALPVVEKAVTIYPDNVTAQSMLADLYATDYQLGYELVENNLEKSFQMSTSAVNIDPESQMAHMVLAFNYYLRNDKEGFLNSAERALAINPFGSNALSMLSPLYGFMGFWDKALGLNEKLIGLNPATPNWSHQIKAAYYYLHDAFETAYAEAKKINMPGTVWDALMKLLTSSALGKTDESNLALKQLIELYPTFKRDRVKIIKRITPNIDFALAVEKTLSQNNTSEDSL